MTIHLYNTLSRQTEPLITREPGKVAMYVCGPTPYDYPHLGNARPAVVFDVVRRYLEYSGYAVTYVTNFTDIEDKIIKRSAEQGVEWRALVERFIAVYFEEMDSLNVKRATVYPRATENIEEIISLVSALVERGVAYVVGGDVYFAVRTFATYGALSNRDLDEMASGARVEVSERKRDPLDFALWKAAKPGEPSWDSPWGSGRPGWHIECSAMSLKYLGAGFDIHGGGQDLIFPHHENEIAQSEAAIDGDASLFARYWMHNGFVTVNAEKMSKSLGNFFVVRDILEKYPAEVVRYFLTAAHYRSPIDFSDQALDQAQAAYQRLTLGVFNIRRVVSAGRQRETPNPEASAALRARLAAAEADFRAAMDDDFNTPRAIAVLFTLVGEANKLTGDPAFVPDAQALTALSDAGARLLLFASVLGIPLEIAAKSEDTLVEPLMTLLLDLRAQARAEKNFALADTIRARLTELGVVLEDTPAGTTWRRK
ncbi:MAG TPA: cysteine--tRNA ligase [Armatimonadota bacterium]|nr:cysteine--tRNA ligase [Armatimonadota bacterium]